MILEVQVEEQRPGDEGMEGRLAGVRLDSAVR